MDVMTGMRTLLAATCFLAGSAWTADELTVTTQQEGNTIWFIGANTNPATPWHAVISFPELQNFRCSVPLPARVVVPPGVSVRLFSLTRANPNAGYAYRVATRSGP